MRFPARKRVDHSMKFLMLPVIVIAGLQGSAQQAPVRGASLGEPIRLDHVGLVIGMPGLLPNVQGTLHVTSKTLSFSTQKASAEIERSTITKVADALGEIGRAHV